MKYSVCAVVAVLALTPDLAHAYGINKSKTGAPVRWGIDTIGFRMDPALAEAFPDGDAYAATTMAFDAWRGLPRVPDLVLRPGAPEAEGYHEGRSTNGIYFIRKWELDPEMLAVTVVTFGSETGEVLDADILVNGEAAYRLLDESAPPDGDHYDLAAVLTHEAGHSLGLDESQAYEQATMWPLVHPGDTFQRTLSEDDEEGVIANYAGALPKSASGCGPASVLGRRSAPGSSLWLLGCALAAALLLARAARGGLSLRRATVACGLCGLLGIAPTNDADSARGAAEGEHACERPSVEHEAADRTRFARVFGQAVGSRALMRGRARRVSAALQHGLIRTTYAVRDASGVERRLELLGGDVDGVSQRFLHLDALPADGAEVVVSEVAGSAAPRWAYYRDGFVFGGSLGVGSAIRF